MNASGGSVEADVETIAKALKSLPREILSEPFPQNPDIQEMKALRSYQQVEAERALTNLTDRIGELRAINEGHEDAVRDLHARIAELERERDEAKAFGAKLQKNIDTNFAAAADASVLQRRIHYLEGRVGGLEGALREMLPIIDATGGTGLPLSVVTEAKRLEAPALKPPMKGPNDE